MGSARADRSRLLDLAAFGLILAGMAWLGARGAEGLGYHWQWYAVPRYFGTWRRAPAPPGLSCGGWA